MPSSVHITVHGKLDISALIHIQYFDAVFCPDGSFIHIIFIIKAENNNQLIFCCLIAEQSVCHLKYDCIPILTLHHGNIRPRNAQKQLIVGIYLPCLRHLGHRSLIIQQVHSVRGISNPVMLLYQIINRLFPICGRHHIIHQERSRLACQLRQRYHRGSDFLHRQISPGNLLKAAVDIYLMEGAVVLQSGICFQILCQLLSRFLIIKSLMKIRHIFQLFRNMQPLRPDNSGVIARLFPLIHLQHKAEGIIRVLFNQIL